MAGAEKRAQAMGVPGQRLMEHAGAAVAASVRAIAEATDRWTKGPILILCGPGNNGGDGFVAARYLARAGAEVAAVLVSAAARPSTAGCRPELGSARPRASDHPDPGRLGSRHARPRARRREGVDRRRCAARLGGSWRAPRSDQVGGRGRASGASGQGADRRGRYADGGRPDLWRRVRAGRSRGPHRDLPSTEDRAAHDAAARAWPARCSSRRSGFRPERIVADRLRSAGWREVLIVAARRRRGRAGSGDSHRRAADGRPAADLPHAAADRRADRRDRPRALADRGAPSAGIVR